MTAYHTWNVSDVWHILTVPKLCPASMYPGILHFLEFQDHLYIQWAKKMSHKRSNFTCQPNCCLTNKGKPVGNFYNKDRHPVLCHPKVQKLSPCHCLYIYFTIGHPKWDSFFASPWFGPLWPLSQPLYTPPWYSLQSHLHLLQSSCAPAGGTS